MEIDEKALDNMAEWMKVQENIPAGWIYIGDENERYVLGQPGKRNLLVFGVNPSTASPGDQNIDPTIRKVRKIAEADCFDGWIMVNLYPYRATNPKDMPQNPDKKLMQKNIKVLTALKRAYRIDRVWAAWGDIIETRSYLRKALYDIQAEWDGNVCWYHKGTLTKKGNPRHPLFMKVGTPCEAFSVAAYAAGLK